MAIITLLTDNGDRDHYTAAIKARILSLTSATSIVDISHRVAPFDIAHGAFLLKSVFRRFPKRTVHLVGVNTTENRDNTFIALELENHFFVGADNGLFGLISSEAPQNAVSINTINPIQSTFPEQDILAPVAAKLTGGIAITSLGHPMASFKKMTERQVKVTRKEIVGRVIHTDRYGNLITNISQDHLNPNNPMTILLGGERFARIHTHYNQVEPGECFIVFNSQALLEIGVSKGRANELLGLDYGSPIIIKLAE